MTPEKKQKVQIGVMAVLAVGFCGNFVVRMMIPSPAANPINPQGSAVVIKSPASASSKSPALGTVVDAVFQDAPSPTDSMKNPFTPQIASLDPLASVAKPTPKGTWITHHSGRFNGAQFPNVAPLPMMSNNRPFVPGVPPLPSSFAGPFHTPLQAGSSLTKDPSQTWTVSGIVDSGDNSIAIIRGQNGRKFVHIGDVLSDGLKVVRITRTKIVLADGQRRYPILLASVHNQAAPAQISTVSQTSNSSEAPSSNVPDNNNSSNSIEELKNTINMPTGGSKGQGTGSAP